MKLTRIGVLCCSLLHVACGDSETSASPDLNVQPPGRPTAAGQGGSFDPFSPTMPSGFEQPTDTRPPVVAENPPPPISGGTLLVSRDGATAIAADPDRDRVSFIDLRGLRVLGHVALEAGDEPGRLTEDGAGRVHVALRGAGAIATFDVAKRSLLERREVCAAPRGIAFDAASDALHVACASGRLVTLPAGGGEALREKDLGPDLRDVVVRDGRLLVSHFKSAKLIELDEAAEQVGEYQPGTVMQIAAIGRSETLIHGPRPHAFTASLARRTVAMGNGRTLMLHERAMADEVEIDDPHSTDDDMTVPGLPGGGGYGNGDSCGSIVQTAVSIVDAEGNVLQSSSLAGAVLPVDVAVSPDGTTIVVANAGNRDPSGVNGRLAGLGMFSPEVLPPGLAPSGGPGGAFSNLSLAHGGSLSFLSTTDSQFHGSAELGDSCTFTTMSMPGQPTAVAYAQDGTLVVQSREPAMLFVWSASGARAIELGGESRLDTGHELFHRDAGGGLACASCHGEGGDDGHVWQFSGLGPRRTQAINVGLGGTAPFHWSGDMRDLSTLMGEVFVGRMGGVPQSPERIDALSNWLFAQKPYSPMRAADDPAALRGKELFESKQVGCAGCHSGEKLTNNASVDVGTGGLFQVPSLVGIAYRAPFIHTGCAETLHERFDPGCGGARHGDVTQLSAEQIDDLVAYLETL